jgi:two-component system, NtrC family, sensor histidine kinase PilS
VISDTPRFQAYAWFGGAKFLISLVLLVGGLQAGVGKLYWLLWISLLASIFVLWNHGRKHIAEELDLDWGHGLCLSLELLCELHLVVLNPQGVSDPTLLFLLTGTIAGFLYRFWGAIPVAMGFTVGFGLLSLTHGLGVHRFPALEGLDGPALLSRWAFTSVLGFLIAILAGFLSESLRSHRIALIGTSQALEMARLDMDAVVNRISSGVLVFDEGLRLLYSNDLAATQMAGLHPGKRLSEIIEKESWGQSVLDGCAQVLESAISWEMETRGNKGATLFFQASGHWVKGKLRILVLTLQDITHLRMMEAEVRSSERMATLGSVAAQIAHEIRNPLASISGSAQLLGGMQGLDAEDSQLLRLIQDESARLSRTLQEFLDFSRIRQPSFRKIQLRPLLEEVRLFLLQRPEAGRYSQTLVRLECPSTLELTTDRDLLLQILQNLALNGLQSVPSGQQIELVLLAEAEKHGTIRISVTDNGTGMADEILERAGEVFFTTKPQGNGLGLANSRQMLASMGGELNLESMPGKGTKAQLNLPQKQVEVRT